MSTKTLGVAILVGIAAAGLQAPAGAAREAVGDGALSARIWTQPNGTSSSVHAGHTPERTAPSEHYDGINCTWTGLVLATDASVTRRDQRQHCDEVIGRVREARAGVERFVGSPLGRSIEVIVLERALAPGSHDVAAQSTAVRADTIGCYRAAETDHGFESERCTGLIAEGASNATPWACQIQLSGDFGTFDGASQRSALAHEVFHCYQRSWSTIDVGAFVGTYPGWLVEGSAAWVGEAVVGGSNISRTWWAHELEGNPTTRTSPDTCPSGGAGPPLACIYGRPRGYSAHSFFFALAVGHGNSAVVDGVRQAFVAGASSDGAAMSSLATASDPVWVNWAAYARRWPAAGDRWDLTAVGITGAQRARWERTLEVASGRSTVVVTAQPTVNRIADVSWRTIAAGEQHLLISLNGNALMRWVNGDRPVGAEVAVSASSMTLDICVTHGHCTGAAMEPPNGADRVVIAVAGGSDAPAGAQVSLECPAERGPTASHIERLGAAPISRCCLVGEWKLTQAPQYRRFNTISGGDGVTLTIDPDGTMTEDFTPMSQWEVTIADRPTSGTFHVKLSGAMTGTVDLERLVRSRRLRSVATDFSGVSVTASATFDGGTIDFGTQPFTRWFALIVAIAGAPPEEVPVDLTCSAETLQLTEQTSTIHYDFQRVSEPVCAGGSCSTRRGSA